MSRRWFALASSFVLCNSLVAAAFAQDSGNPSSGHSIFSWFGWHGSSSDSQQNGNSSNGRMMANNDGIPQWNLGSRDQMPPDPANSQSDSLPGLGGSPLPRKGTPAANGNNSNNSNNGSNNSGGGGNAGGRQNGLRQPQSNSSQRYTTSGQNYPNGQNSQNYNQNYNRKSTRQLDISPPGGEPATAPANESGNSSNSQTRQSPSRRTSPHVNANDLRNELSGSFAQPGGTGPSPRTARADEHGSMGAGSSGQRLNAAPSPLPANDQTMPISDHASDSESRSAAEAFGSHELHAAVGGGTFVRTPYSNALPPGPQTARGKEAFGDALQVASGGDPSVLASNQTPILSADIRGPKQILIGRESVYRIRLQNNSDVPAEGIVATVRIPAGADVVNATGTQGMVQQSQDATTKGQLQWQIGRLDRHAGETLELRLVPHESRPLELGVTWTVAPVGERAVVEVQEPKLQIDVAGPNEVYYDKSQVFKLTISNPGTGPAENVHIELSPPGGKKENDAKEAPQSHALGDLPAGASQTVEVELTAREAGKLFVKATATAEGGLTCNAAKEVFCRKPELEVDWRGPATKYAGTQATYFLRVRNPGTAPAEDVTVRAALPDGAEFTSASDGQNFDPKLREVSWHVGTLRPGDDNYMELKCVLKNAGNNQLKITAATATGSLTDTKTAATNVVALADLKLDVVDPTGPVAVGSPAFYEIHIRNRGASAAKDVNVMGFFSEGIEPEQAEGAMYTVADGRVSFRTINELPAGRDLVLRIRAHAVSPGTHIFRAEVLCRDLDIKLAAEDTTRFYTDDVAPTGDKSDKSDKQSAGRSDAFRPTVR